jgi:hypothetical protein
MKEVSLFCLYALRAMYLFIARGLGVYSWLVVLQMLSVARGDRWFKSQASNP